jgi:transcriptional regulator with XRE-family HTH domain
MKSSSLHLDKRRRAFVRLLGEIQHALLEALDEEHRNRGLTRADIAKLIGRNKSFVTRKLNGDSNMTLQTLADLAFALNRPVKVKLSSRAVAAGSNRIAPPATSHSPPQPDSNASSTTRSDGISAMAA